jgi:hypothetical protein
LDPKLITFSALFVFGLIFLFGRPFKYSQKLEPNLESAYFGPLFEYKKEPSEKKLVALKKAGIAYWKSKGFSSNEISDLIQKDLNKVMS